MAQRFISGMSHTYANEAGGQFFSRFLIEWLTKVVGWGAFDLISAGSKWDNVAGSGTAAVTSKNVIEVTSPSYVFSSSNVDWFLTVTGYTGGNEKYNGIYKIRRFLGVVGSVYTLEVYPYGVHHDGLVVQSGLSWRLWAGTSAYCPTLDSEIAVLTGTGHTGAGLSNGARSSVTLSISQGGSVSTLMDTGATFLDSDVGKSITVSGSLFSGNNDTFTIASRISDTQITYTNGSGVTDASFTGSWAITYNFHLHYKFYTAESCGRIRMSPYASWDNGTHAWAVGDSRYTSEIGINIDNWQGIYQRMWLWAEADTDHFTIVTHCVTSDYNLKHIRCYAVGELDAFHPEADPRPLWSWAGVDSGGDAVNYLNNAYQPVFGYPVGGASLWNYNFIDRFRGLAYDDLTTITYYASFAHSLGSTNSNIHVIHTRLFSKFSNNFYLTPIILESRTTQFMEFRGTLRNMWICNASLPLLRESGTDGDYLHIMRSVMIPWHGAKLSSPFTGYQAIG